MRKVGRGKRRTFRFGGLRETEAPLYWLIGISMPHGIKSSQANQNMCTLFRLLKTSSMFKTPQKYSVLHECRTLFNSENEQFVNSSKRKK